MNKKRVRSLLFVLLLTAGTPLCASWFGETWLWVEARRIAPVAGKDNVKAVEFRVIHWGRGGGHGDSYGRSFPGQILTQEVQFSGKAEAETLKPGQKFWIYHRVATWFTRSRGDKAARMGSSRRWVYQGDKVWAGIHNIVYQAPPASGRTVTLLWAVRHGELLSFKIRYNTYGRYRWSWKFYLNENRLSIVQEKGDTYSQVNPRKVDERAFQFDGSDLRGKRISLWSGNRQLGVWQF